MASVPTGGVAVAAGGGAGEGAAAAEAAVEEKAEEPEEESEDEVMINTQSQRFTRSFAGHGILTL